MKILLLSPPARPLVLRDYCCSETCKGDYYWTPIDLLVLSGLLAEKYEIAVLDATAEGIGAFEVERRLIGHAPDVVISLTGAVTIHQDMELLRRIRERTGCTVLVIGDVAYFEPQMTLEMFPFLDGIIFEFASPEVGRYLEGVRTDLKDLAYRHEGKITVGTKNRQKSVSYPMPRHELFPLERNRLPWARRHPMATVLSNYGCPFKCTYCPSGMLVFRWRPLEEFIEELRYIRRLGVEEVFLRDFTFNLERARSLEVCEAILDNDIRLSWSCEARVDGLDPEILQTMRRAGCHTVMLGIETASDELQEETAKYITADQTREALAACRRVGITTLGHFIIGLPGESQASILRTIEFAKEVGCDYAAFNLFVPRLGTILRRTLVAENRVQADDLRLLDCSSDGMELSDVSRTQLKALHRKALREFYLRPGHLLRLLRGVESSRHLANMMANGFAVARQMIQVKG